MKNEECRMKNVELALLDIVIFVYICELKHLINGHCINNIHFLSFVLSFEIFH